ncbi:hypothetical protein JXQ70_10210 [bacterium]|nr:hypothetical protein [bacterium]
MYKNLCILLLIIYFNVSCIIVYDLEDSKSDKNENDSSINSFIIKVLDKVAPLIYNHDTKYAVGYKEDVFQSLKMGLTQYEVKKLIGEPLTERKNDKGDIIWHYSEPGKKYDHFYNRVLIFDINGKLIERYSEFYID